MRAAYREQMDNFSHDLIIMSDNVHSLMTLASQALVESALQPAEVLLAKPRVQHRWAAQTSGDDASTLAGSCQIAAVDDMGSTVDEVCEFGGRAGSVLAALVGEGRVRGLAL